MSKQIEAIKRWVEVFDGNWHDEPVDTEWADRAHQALAAMRQAIAEAEQPAQQENSKLFDSLIDEMLDHSYQGSHDSAEKVANEIRRMYRAAHGIRENT